jgi:soluble lytic murein transglycosylase
MEAKILCLALISLGYPRVETACEHMETIVQEAEKNDLDPALVVAVIRIESRFKKDAVSRANACGLMQVLPQYTKNPKLSCDDLKDPTTNIIVGTKKLNFWIYKYGKGSVRTGLCGYNAGFRCKGDKKNKAYYGYAVSALKHRRKIKREYEKLKEECYLEESDYWYQCLEYPAE